MLFQFPGHSHTTTNIKQPTTSLYQYSNNNAQFKKPKTYLETFWGGGEEEAMNWRPFSLWISELKQFNSKPPLVIRSASNYLSYTPDSLDWAAFTVPRRRSVGEDESTLRRTRVKYGCRMARSVGSDFELPELLRDLTILNEIERTEGRMKERRAAQQQRRARRRRRARIKCSCCRRVGWLQLCIYNYIHNTIYI